MLCCERGSLLVAVLRDNKVSATKYVCHSAFRLRETNVMSQIKVGVKSVFELVTIVVALADDARIALCILKISRIGESLKLRRRRYHVRSVAHCAAWRVRASPGECQTHRHLLELAGGGRWH